MRKGFGVLDEGDQERRWRGDEGKGKGGRMSKVAIWVRDNEE